MSDIYKQYYEIRHQIDTLKGEEERLKELVLEEALKSEENTIKTEFGTFQKRTSKRWSFSMDFMEKSMAINKKIIEFSKPLKEKIDEFSKPLMEEIEELKKTDVYEGKAKEQVDVTIAFSYNQYGK